MTATTTEIPTATATEIPTATPDWARGTLIANQGTAVALEILNASTEGTLQVEESNQRQRLAQTVNDDRRTQEAIAFTLAMTSTATAQAVQVAAVVFENQHKTEVETAWSAFWMGIIGAVVASILAPSIWFRVQLGKRGLTAWDMAGVPERVEEAEIDLSRTSIQVDNSIKFPLAGDICTDDELRAIAGVWVREHNLIVASLEKAGVSSEAWIGYIDSNGQRVEGIRDRMIARGLLEKKRNSAKRLRVAPTVEGEALFNEIGVNL